jgi:hypothetical protein
MILASAACPSPASPVEAVNRPGFCPLFPSRRQPRRQARAILSAAQTRATIRAAGKSFGALSVTHQPCILFPGRQGRHASAVANDLDSAGRTAGRPVRSSTLFHAAERRVLAPAKGEGLRSREICGIPRLLVASRPSGRSLVGIRRPVRVLLWKTEKRKLLPGWRRQFPAPKSQAALRQHRREFYQGRCSLDPR